MAKIEEMKASDIMSSPVISVGIREKIQDVAAMFVEKGISGAVVVGESGGEKGAITKTDIVRYASRPADSDKNTLEYWFTPEVYAVSPDANLLSVTNEMLKRRNHHVFVRDSSGKIGGIITTLDLVHYLSHYLMRVPRGDAPQDE